MIHTEFLLIAYLHSNPIKNCYYYYNLHRLKHSPFFFCNSCSKYPSYVGLSPLLLSALELIRPRPVQTQCMLPQWVCEFICVSVSLGLDDIASLVFFIFFGFSFFLPLYGDLNRNGCQSIMCLNVWF